MIRKIPMGRSLRHPGKSISGECQSDHRTPRIRLARHAAHCAAEDEARELAAFTGSDDGIHKACLEACAFEPEGTDDSAEVTVQTWRCKNPSRA